MKIYLNLFGFVCAHTCAYANGMKIVYSGSTKLHNAVQRKHLKLRVGIYLFYNFET